MHWHLHPVVHAIWFSLGETNASGWPYLAWSGWVPAVCGLTVIGGVWAAARKHNCHVKGCWRMWHHEITDGDGVTHKVCHRHHPGRPRHVHLHHIEDAWGHHTLRHRSAR